MEYVLEENTVPDFLLQNFTFMWKLFKIKSYACFFFSVDQIFRYIFKDFSIYFI